MKLATIFSIVLSIFGLSTKAETAPLCYDVYTNASQKVSFLHHSSGSMALLADLSGAPRTAKKDRFEELKEKLEENPNDVDLLLSTFILSYKMLDNKSIVHWRLQTDIVKRLLRLKAEKGDQITDADLVEFFEVLVKKKEGATEAIAVARELQRRHPKNIDFFVMELRAEIKLENFDYVIAKTNENIAKSPRESIWYELQIIVRNQIEFQNSSTSYRSRHYDNASELARLLDQAILLEDLSYLIVNNYLRIQAASYIPGFLKGYTLDYMLTLVEKMNSLATTPSQKRVVEFRYAEIYFAAGKYELSMDHFEASLHEGKVSPYKANFKYKLEREMRKEDGGQRGDEYDDRPDWMKHRDSDGVDYLPNMKDWQDY